MGVYLKWSLRRLVNSICDRLMNKFDVFIIIEGKRGLGKSTLGFKLMRMVKLEMKRRKVKGYNFKPYFDILYQRKEVLRFFNKWRHSGLADEMINVSFNRDFYDPDQKDLIKIINMNRDHNNFFIACVPQFKVLDSQIKNLCSMKITVIRRGVGIIHMPNKTVYSSDIWDEKFNEKVERGWLMSGVRNPHYSKLSTFKGFVGFPKLTDKQEALYQKIKDEKRNIIAKEKQLEDFEEKDPFTIIYNALIEGKVKNTAMLEGMMVAHDLNLEGTKSKLRNTLKKNLKSSSLVAYYYDDKNAKEKIDKERKVNEITQIIQKIKSKELSPASSK